MQKLIGRFLADQTGQDLIEYALLMGLIAIICIAAIQSGGRAISTYFWNVISDQLNGVSGS